jgi:transposase
MGRDGKMGVQLDVSSGDGYAGRLEVIEGRSGRRLRSQEERARIAAESFMPGVRVADAARKHGTTRWQIYDWRKRLRDGRLVLPERFAALPSFAALVVEDLDALQAASQSASQSASRLGVMGQSGGAGVIEVIVDDVMIRADVEADVDHLSRVIRAARAATG